MKQPYLECGKIVSTHGVRGDVRLDSYCDAPEVAAKLPAVYFRNADGTFTPRRVTHGTTGRGQAILHLSGIDDMDAAVALRGTVVYAKREDLPLPPGAHFIADLLGLPVIDADTGKVYGEIADVEQMPSSDVYTVRTKTGDVLFPAVREYVVNTDPDTGVYIRPIPGFFEEGDA